MYFFVRTLIIKASTNFSVEWTCRTKYTGWNAEGGGKNYYLDRHDVKCDANEAIRSFRLHRNGKGNYRYRYLCCKLPDLTCSRNENKNTKLNDDGGGKSIYLDRHDVSCGSSFITNFKLYRGRSTIAYKYGCCSVDKIKKVCYDADTGFNSDGNSNTVYLVKSFFFFFFFFFFCFCTKKS